MRHKTDTTPTTIMARMTVISARPSDQSVQTNALRLAGRVKRKGMAPERYSRPTLTAPRVRATQRAAGKMLPSVMYSAQSHAHRTGSMYQRLTCEFHTQAYESHLWY